MTKLLRYRTAALGVLMLLFAVANTQQQQLFQSQTFADRWRQARSQTATSQTAARQCSFAIQNFKKGPADYQRIMSAGQLYSDPVFPPNSDALLWSDYPRSGSFSLQWLLPYVQWSRPMQKFSGTSLYGTYGISGNDIIQGSLNDCYVLAPAQAMAERGTRIDKIFITDKYPNSPGIIAMNLFVKGKPEVMTIDDNLPFVSGNPIFSKRSGDNDFWTAFIEKGFAKMTGNYENIGGGWQAETWRVLNGAPTRFYMMTQISNDPNQAWNIIRDALFNGFMVGVDTGSSPPFTLVAGHAYSVVSTHELKDAWGNVQQRLFRVRNPWGSDRYNGPWSDGDTSRWTAAYQSQVPYSNSNDGYFFIDPQTFVSAFLYFQVNYFRDSWRTNYYEKLNDDGTWKTYTFTLDKAQDVFIGADFYNPRMYAEGCRQGQRSKGQYNLLRGSTVIDRYSFDDRLGYGWTQYTALGAGTYTLQFQATWTAWDVKDYVISVYAADQILIYDQWGKTSFTTTDLTSVLKNDLSTALRDVSSYTFENGGWYTINRGYFDAPSNNKFFFRYGGPIAAYDLNVQIAFTSFDSTAVTTDYALQGMTQTRNADGSTTHSHFCQIRPKQGINDCSYMVYAPNSASGVKFTWTLHSWSYN